MGRWVLISQSNYVVILLKTSCSVTSNSWKMFPSVSKISSGFTLTNIVILQYLAVVYHPTVVLHLQLIYNHCELGMIRMTCTNVNVSLVCRNMKSQHFTLATGRL